MNYKRIITRYEKEGVNQLERSLCIKFFWDVDHEWKKYIRKVATNLKDLYESKPNLAQLIPVIGEEYGMTEDEAEYIYGIGKEQIDEIDRMKFSRRLYKPK